ncbi:MAG TPA: ABC transporter permease [bacterium]|nr:ABC transporter permease [bacterium]
MHQYVIRRVLQMIPIILGISVVVFALLLAAPGDQVDLLISGVPNITPDEVARLKHVYGLDEPVHVRYVKWLERAVQGDFGWSRTYKERVTSLIFDRLGNTVSLAAGALVLALAVAVPVGIYSALHQYSALDYGATLFTFFGVSVPVFWFGIMLIYVFGVTWHLLPPGGINSPGVAPGLPMILDRLQYLPLPTLALGLVFMASFTRYTRSSMLEVVRQDFVRTAKAKGLPGRVVIRRHALRNALIPLVTVLGVAIPGVLAGAPLTETVFSWPGVGKLLVDSTLGGDYAVAQGIIMFISIMVVAANLLVDVAYGVLDPRIRYD